MSPTTTGDDLISDRVLNDHVRLPLARSTACTTPSRSPMKPRPDATAGEDSPIVSATFNRHRSLPSLNPMATTSTVAVPTKTVSPTIAGDDSMASPPSHDQTRFSVAGTFDENTPVREGVPRNCGQASAGGAPPPP